MLFTKKIKINDKTILYKFFSVFYMLPAIKMWGIFIYSFLIKSIPNIKSINF